MVYRKGELQKSRIDREWPHQIALPAKDCTVQNYHPVHNFCREAGLSLCERGHNIAESRALHIVFCFADPDHARIFQEQFGGFKVEPNAVARRLAAERLSVEQGPWKLED